MRARTPEERLDSLENWRRDVAKEMREWEEWHDLVKPFIEQLQADLVYRQRRHAENTHTVSTFARVVGWSAGIAVALAAVGSFILQIVHAAG